MLKRYIRQMVYILPLTLFFGFLPAISLAEQVVYTKEGISSPYFGVDLRADFNKGSKQDIYSPGDELLVDVTLNNSGEYCLLDGTFIYSLVAGRRVPEIPPFDTDEATDRGNIIMETALPIVSCPGKAASLPISIKLPKDLRAGDYRVDLYLRSPRLVINGSHDIYKPATFFAFKITGSGDFPQAKIVRSKTRFAGARYQSGPVVEANTKQASFVTVANEDIKNSFSGKLSTSVCAFSDLSGLGCRNIGNRNITVPPGSSESFQTDINVDFPLDAYTVYYQLTDKDGRVNSRYKNVFIIKGQQSNIRSLVLNKSAYTKGDTVNMQAGIGGPYTQGYSAYSVKDITFKADLYDRSGLFEKKIFSGSKNFPTISTDGEVPFQGSLVAESNISSYKLCGTVSDTNNKILDSRCVVSGEDKTTFPWSIYNIVVATVVLLIVLILWSLWRKFKRHAPVVLISLLISTAIFLSLSESALAVGVARQFRSPANFFGGTCVNIKFYYPANGYYYTAGYFKDNVLHGFDDSGGQFCLADYQAPGDTYPKTTSFSYDLMPPSICYQTGNESAPPPISDWTGLYIGKDDATQRYYIPKGTVAHLFRPVYDDPTATENHGPGKEHIVVVEPKDPVTGEPLTSYFGCVYPPSSLCPNGAFGTGQSYYPAYVMDVIKAIPGVTSTSIFKSGTTLSVNISAQNIIDAINANTYSNQGMTLKSQILPPLSTNDVPDLSALNGGDLSLIDSYIGLGKQGATSPYPSQIFNNYAARCLGQVKPYADAGTIGGSLQIASTYQVLNSFLERLSTSFENIKTAVSSAQFFDKKGLLAAAWIPRNAAGVPCPSSPIVLTTSVQTYSGNITYSSCYTNITLNNGNVFPNYYANIITFDGSVGQMITATLVGGTATAPHVYLFNSAGGVIIANGTLSGQISSYSLPATDSYTMVVMDDSGGVGTYQIKYSFTAPLAIPNTPVISTVVGNRSMTINWNVSSGADDYYIYRNDVKIATVSPGSVVSYLDTNNGVGLTNGIQYCYKVTAHNGAGESQPQATGACATPARPAQDKPSSGMVSWWKGEGNLNDFLGSNTGIQGGSLAGGSLYTTAGNFGQAFTFNGADFIYMPANASLNLGGSTGNGATIEAWVYQDNANKAGLQGIIVKQFAYGLFLYDGKLRAHSWAGSTGFKPPVVASPGTDLAVDLANGRWHHVAMTFKSGEVNGTKIYVDGLPVFTTTITMTTPDTVMTIGTGGPSSGQFFRGRIDEPAVYNRVLTPGEIWNIYAGGFRLTPPATPTLSAILDGGFRIAWTAVAGATSHQLLISTSPTFISSTVAIPALTASPVTHIPTGADALSSAITYYYRVSATDGDSTVYSGILNAGSPKLMPPVLTATAGDARVDLVWPKSAGAIVYYIYRNSVDKNANFDIRSPNTVRLTALSSERCNTNSCSYPDGGLPNNIVYYYKISASKVLISSYDPNIESTIGLTGVSAIPNVACVSASVTSNSTAQTNVRVNGTDYWIDLDGVRAWLWDKNLIIPGTNSSFEYPAGTDVVAEGVLGYRFMSSGFYYLYIREASMSIPEAFLFQDRRPK